MPLPRTLTACLPALAMLAGSTNPVLGQADRPRNLILFIADGAGANTHRALESWRGTPPVYTGDGWQRHEVTTYGLRNSVRPVRGLAPLDQDPRLVFDAEAAYDSTPTDRELGGYAVPFEGYAWLRMTAPDSANTATALMTGVTTYKGAINVDGNGEPVPSLGQLAAQRGMAVGVVSSVPFSHATPACAGGAHVPRREMYHEITHQLLTNGVCTVIAGAGHPEFDDSAQALETPNYKFIAESDFAALRAGAIGAPDKPAWTLVEDVSVVRSLATGDTPEQLFIMAKAAQTLQQVRAPWAFGDSTAPGGHAPNQGVPTLLELSLAGLNAVDDDPDGFILVIEAGAVDWAMHDNQIGRMIEEMADFHDTIEAFAEMLDSGDRGFDWSDTLVLVTADHDHLLLGPESDRVAFQPLQDRGPGSVPGHLWYADNHSNLPVPLFVRGRGSDAFHAIETTSHGTPHGPIDVFHQVEIGRVLLDMLAGHGVAAQTETSNGADGSSE